MTDLNESIRNIPIPERMRRLPISKKGFPVPWFVAKVNGEWDFRVIGTNRLKESIVLNKCWLCGELLGVYKAFVTGPMCTITRTSAEPPSHLECAKYAVAACPFLTQPNMKRNEKDLPPERMDPAGIFITRNPGVTAIYVTKTFKLMQVRRETKGSDILIRMGTPYNIEWYAEGRIALREEVQKSIDTGMPVLVKEAARDNAFQELEKCVQLIQKWLPEAGGGNETI